MFIKHCEILYCNVGMKISHFESGGGSGSWECNQSTGLVGCMVLKNVQGTECSQQNFAPKLFFSLTFFIYSSDIDLVCLKGIFLLFSSCMICIILHILTSYSQDQMLVQDYRKGWNHTKTQNPFLKVINFYYWTYSKCCSSAVSKD